MPIPNLSPSKSLLKNMHALCLDFLMAGGVDLSESGIARIQPPDTPVYKRKILTDPPGHHCPSFLTVSVM